MTSSEKQRAIFAEWLRDHAGILHHTVNGFAESADRDDLMQELMLAVWKSIPAFRGESKVSTFLYQVTHHAAMTWRRKGRLHERKIEAFRRETHGATASFDDSASLLLHPPGTDAPADPSGGMADHGNHVSGSASSSGSEDRSEKLERLYAEIRRLPALDRSLVLLSLDGMSYRAIATVHGLSESNVGARLTRARQKLTSALNPRQPPPQSVSKTIKPPMNQP